ncbi:MAG: ATP-binding cassette domain-containing protein [Microvirgula sp.]
MKFSTWAEMASSSMVLGAAAVVSKIYLNSSLWRKVASDICKSTDHWAKFHLLKALVIVCLSAVLLSLSPIFMSKIIDGANKGHFQAGNGLLAAAACYIGLRFAGQIFVDLRWVIINPALYSISYAMCSLTTARLAHVSRRKNVMGESVSIVAEQVAVMSKMGVGAIGFLHSIVAVIVPTVIELIIVCIAVTIVIGPWVVFCIAVGGAVFFVGVSFLRGKELASLGSANYKDNIVSSSLAEYLSNPDMIREFSADEFFNSRLKLCIDDSITTHQKLFLIKTERSLCLTLITCTIYAITLLLTIGQPEFMDMSAGGVFLLIVYLDRIQQPLINISLAINGLYTGMVSMKGAYDMLDLFSNESMEKLIFLNDHHDWKVIKINQKKGIYFSDDVMHIGAGTWVRVLGPSGSGKSMYLRRIYYKLLIEKVCAGNDIHYLNPTPALVEGTVAENIALGNVSVTRSDIEMLWGKWNKLMGNRKIDVDIDASKLSAGEMQFLALCRTLLRNPSVVVLDEATNSIDAKSEEKVWGLVREYLPESTIFIVTHRDVEAMVFDCFVDFCGEKDFHFLITHA